MNYTVNYITDATLPPDAYRLTQTTIASSGAAGAMYGKYALDDYIKLGGDVNALDVTSIPAAKNRVVNHWDNLDGTVERGYAGGSLFFKDGDFNWDEARITEYAEMLAKVGINGISLNNVNLRDDSRRLITDEKLPKLAEIAVVFRKFHVRLIIAVDFASPKTVGGLPTADPFDGEVQAWWAETVKRVYSYIPDLMGFLVKADSEFQAGPAALGRTQADGANVLAAALAPYGGTVFWRCFVYNCQQDWRDTVTDRPKAAYEHFKPLDGDFAENVVLQIKIGPVDFQVSEPVSPLFNALEKTRRAIELQITQEYTGQQIDLYATAVPWAISLQTLIRPGRTLSDMVGIDTIAGVSNVGDDENWTGHPLALANLYAFGKLAWNPKLHAEDILRDWTVLTFGNDDSITAPITGLLLASAAAYYGYTAPMGIGWFVNPGHHYGVNVDGYEYSQWGTYHRASHSAIGVDRTSTGTNLTAQYDPVIAALYENPKTCPENLLLFFHRLPYNFRMPNGETLLQRIYDTRFDGVELVEHFIKTWRSLETKLPPKIYAEVAARFEKQLKNAVEWRDVVNTYFYRLTGIADGRGRVIYG
jgi:alpha-glucuronidase